MVSEKLINVAAGREKADLVLKNGSIVDVFTGEIFRGDIAIADGYIAGTGSYEGEKETELNGKYVVPGFINSHVHVESSMVTPQTYSMEELMHGTTTIITDPHEIINVGGEEALRDILEAAEECAVNYYVMLPSCVPATPFEHSGAVLPAESLIPFRDDPHVPGLGEMMNAPGVIGCDEGVLEKLRAFSSKIIDGHAPMLTGKELNAYACTGIATDHESVTFEEAREKLRCGIAVLIREGSASRNLEAIVKGVIENGTDTSRLAFCTDDKHLADIRREGTIRHNIEKAIQLGLDPIKAIRMATLNAARIYGLKDVGAIAPGFRADIVVLDDPEKVTVSRVFKDGIPAEEIKPCRNVKKRRDDTPVNGRHPLHSVNAAPVSEKVFEVPQSEEYSVIGLVEGQLLTRHIKMTHSEVTEGLKDGSVRKIAVIERHHATGSSSCCYITGYGLSHGAIGTTVAHDSHNIIILGDNSADMLRAFELLKEINGGYVLVADGKTQGALSLSLGGLMSTQPAHVIIPQIEEMIGKAHALGVPSGIDPFITLSFTALPVIPQLRITDRGLFDVTSFSFIKQ